MSRSDNNPDIAQQFLHIKVLLEGVEVDFKGNRPRLPISVKLKAGEDLHKSPRFGEGEVVRWNLENCIHILTSTDFVVVVQEVHKFNRKKELAAFLFRTADIAGREAFLTEDSNGRAAVNLICVPISPTNEFAELLISEARIQLGNKKAFLDSLGKAGQAVAILVKFIDVASDVHPAAVAAVIAVNMLYERCKLQQDCHAAAVELMKDLALFLPFTKDVPLDLMKNATTRQTVKQILELFCQISMSIIRYSSKGLLGDLISSHKDEIDTQRVEFTRLKNTYDWCVKTEIWRSVIRTERHAEDQQLSRLRPAREAFYNIENICLEGTRTAVFEQITQWAESDSNLFWLHGLAGSGKSSIANSVAYIFEQQRRLSGCFFCKSDDPECRVPKNMFPTLAYNLAKWHKVYRSTVLSVLQGDDEPKLAQSLQWQFDLLVKQPLDSLGSSADLPPRPLIVVIDALDECGDSSESRSQLAMFIAQLAVAVPWLKVFVTSRSLPEIRQNFVQDALNHQSLDISTQSDDNELQLDILQYTRHCAKNLMLSDNQIYSFALKASGLFIWTSTVFKFIFSQRDKHRAVESVLSPASPGHHESDIDKLYTTVIWSASEGVDNARVVKSVLGVIFSTAKNRPLPEDALVHFLSDIDVNTLKDTIDCLQAVLYRDSKNNNAIRVCHPSFLDFIREKRRCLHFWTDPKMLDSDMAIRCFHIMMSGLRFNICNLDSSFITDDNVSNLNDKISRHISQHLQYSTLYWMNHLLGSSLGITDASVEELLSALLLKPRALYWLECLSLMKKLKSGIDILIYMLDVLTGDAVGNPLKGHSGQVNSIAYSPDGKHIVSGSSDMTLCVWDLQIGNIIGTPLRGHSGWIHAVVYSPDGNYIVSGSDDSTLRIWDAQTRDLLCEPLRGHSSGVSCIACSPNGRHIASGSYDKTLYIWDAYTGVSVWTTPIHHVNKILCVTYSPDGNHIASTTANNDIYIWDAQTGSSICGPLNGHINLVRSVAYSPDGKHIVSGSDDSTLRIWDAHSGDVEIKALRGHSNRVYSVSYSPNGKHIVSGSVDTTLRLWDAQIIANTIEEPLTLTGHSGQVFSVAYSPNGKHIVSGSADTTLCIWDAENGDAVGMPFRGHSDCISCVAYSPDGKFIVSGSEDMTLLIWNAQTGDAVGEPLWGHLGLVSCVAYSPDGKHVVSGSRDETLRIWDVRTCAVIGDPLAGHTAWVRAVAYSPDGRYIVSGSNDTTLRIWNSRTRIAVGKPLRGHTGWVRSVMYSPDGRYIASGSDDNTIRIWDAQSGEAIGKPFIGHTTWVRTIAYSPDGRFIVSGSADHTLRIWNAETGEAIGKPLSGHSHYLNSVAYSPDGRHIVSGSNDMTLSIWDAQAVVAGVSKSDYPSQVSADANPVDGRNDIPRSNEGTSPSEDATDTDPSTKNVHQRFPLQITDNGWCKDSEGRLLLWVPPEYHEGVRDTSTHCIPADAVYRHVTLDTAKFEQFSGPSWVNIIKNLDESENAIRDAK
ncbi:hypothetical protein EW145_g4721 [Phellinidium pouzarii]|uniref:Nephrocystin 3-like N-terminal domain-containing protein n=1 Tax=Phellinidium pouzarii TaxID=167371 RepID=A0A4S4L2P7_9AGAM|nr:hypothetical protein EW145_g4721 [Phellinidium pouzarii]